jgi:hypothetical protein
MYSTHERGENAYSILLGRHEGKRPYKIRKSRWEDDIKMDLREGTSDLHSFRYDKVMWRVSLNTAVNIWHP